MTLRGPRHSFRVSAAEISTESRVMPRGGPSISEWRFRLHDPRISAVFGFLRIRALAKVCRSAHTPKSSGQKMLIGLLRRRFGINKTEQALFSPRTNYQQSTMTPQTKYLALHWGNYHVDIFMATVMAVSQAVIPFRGRRNITHLGNFLWSTGIYDCLR